VQTKTSKPLILFKDFQGLFTYLSKHFPLKILYIDEIKYDPSLPKHYGRVDPIPPSLTRFRVLLGVDNPNNLVHRHIACHEYFHVYMGDRYHYLFANIFTAHFSLRRFKEVQDVVDLYIEDEMLKRVPKELQISTGAALEVNEHLRSLTNQAHISKIPETIMLRY